MSENTFFKFRLCFTGIVTILIWSVLAWDHFHGGVPSHHILARKDMPEISNWWGGFLVPLVTWFLLYRVKKRAVDENSQFPSKIIYAFVGALTWGILLSTFFELGVKNLPFYMLIGLLISSLFLPIYRAECFLGFIFGMTLSFGGVLPVLVISIISSIGAVLNLVVRPAAISGFSFVFRASSPPAE